MRDTRFLSELAEFLDFLFLILMVLLVLSLVVLGGISILEKEGRKSEAHGTPPGELVDKAMAIQGAIVISPHRDLAELGIYNTYATAPGGYQYVFPLYACAPTIAVKTRTKWCLWGLGSECVVKLGRHMTGDPVTINGYPYYVPDGGSFHGYQEAYDVFTKCIHEGNQIDPIKDFGAVCNGKHDDTKALGKAMREAEKWPMGSVKIPNNCTVHTLRYPSGPIGGDLTVTGGGN